METLGEAIEAIKDYLPNKGGVTTEQMLEEALQDEDVKEFIQTNNISDETIQTYRSKLIEYHRGTQAGKKLELAYSDGYKHAIIEVREEPPVIAAKRKILILDSVTESMRGLKFADLVRDPFNDKLINALERLVGDYSAIKDKPGIWVHGEFGRGKSYILGALANELHQVGVGVTYISVRTFVARRISEGFDRDDYLQRVANQDVLILDDMGTEPLSDKDFAWLYSLLDNRQAKGLLTFASSNFTIKEYTQTINSVRSLDVQRMETRLINLFNQFHLGGENKRRR